MDPRGTGSLSTPIGALEIEIAFIMSNFAQTVPFKFLMLPHVGTG
jgi:hypothetical protein